MQKEKPSRLIAAKLASAEYGVPYSSLRAAAFRGDLKVVRLGSKNSRRQAWYFHRAELDRFFTSKSESLHQQRGAA